jgi:hypothetical protein
VQTNLRRRKQKSSAHGCFFVCCSAHILQPTTTRDSRQHINPISTHPQTIQPTNNTWPVVGFISFPQYYTHTNSQYTRNHLFFYSNDLYGMHGRRYPVWFSMIRLSDCSIRVATTTPNPYNIHDVYNNISLPSPPSHPPALLVQMSVIVLKTQCTTHVHSFQIHHCHDTFPIFHTQHAGRYF